MLQNGVRPRGGNVVSAAGENSPVETAAVAVEAGAGQSSLLVAVSGNITVGLWARNQLKFRSLLYLAISLVSLAFQIILAKVYGAIGCSIAIGGALLLGQGLIMNIYYRKRQYIDIAKFWKEIVRMLIAPALLTAICMLASHWIKIESVSAMVLTIIVFSILFIALVWKFSMNEYEHQIVSSPLRKILHK